MTNRYATIADRHGSGEELGLVEAVNQDPVPDANSNSTRGNADTPVDTTESMAGEEPSALLQSQSTEPNFKSYAVVGVTVGLILLASIVWLTRRSRVRSPIP